jgi:predicted transcriptional regulator YdeE
MNIQIAKRNEFAVCGYAVETTLENNDADIGTLYRDFFETGKDRELLALSGAQPGLYGVEWYTQGHKSFFYMLGLSVDKRIRIPQGAMLKVIPAAEYAVTKVQEGSSLVDAWTAFFYTDIPAAQLKPDEAHGFFFEYYPGGTDGDCELWVPVVKS